MGNLPAHVEAARKRLSHSYLCGSGVEVGALHRPLIVSRWKTLVTYVDRISEDELRRHYPELNQLNLTPIDVVDNGELLSNFTPRSLDFIIANHFLEHCQNPLGTLRAHLEKLRPGGILYYAIPDKRFTFDSNRPLTPLDHFISDDQDQGKASRASHYEEYVKLVETWHPDSESVSQQIRNLMNKDYSIHFHVWDRDHFLDFLKLAQEYLKNSFEIVETHSDDHEVIAILRRIPFGVKDRVRMMKNRLPHPRKIRRKLTRTFYRLAGK
jgi:SAM-dependent methyltransferase